MRARTPLEQICARGDHVNSLQEELPEQKAASEEVRPYRNSLLRCTVCPVICLRIYIGCQLGRGVENVLPEARVSVEQP